MVRGVLVVAETLALVQQLRLQLHCFKAFPFSLSELFSQLGKLLWQTLFAMFLDKNMSIQVVQCPICLITEWVIAFVMSFDFKSLFSLSPTSSVVLRVGIFATFINLFGFWRQWSCFN